jgi:hypothetical protein
MLIELVDKENQKTFGNLKAIKLLSDDGVINNGLKFFIDCVEPIEVKTKKCNYKSIEIFGLTPDKWEIVKIEEDAGGPEIHNLYGFNPNTFEKQSAITWTQFYEYIKEIQTH